MTTTELAPRTHKAMHTNDLPAYEKVVLPISMGVDAGESDPFVVFLKVPKLNKYIVLATEKSRDQPFFPHIPNQLREKGAASAGVQLSSRELIEKLRSEVIGSAHDEDSLKSAARSKLTNYVEDAVNRGASDIHFYCDKDVSNIRYRIDGLLADISTEKGGTTIAFLTTVFNSLSDDPSHSSFKDNDDIDCRVPVTINRTVTRFGGKPLEHPVVERLSLRYQGSYTVDKGYDVVARILFPEAKQDESAGLDALGYCSEQLSIIETGLRRPNGAVVVTGVTGSGKTVTLNAMYTFLYNFRDGRIHIRSVENPVETRNPCVRQKSITNNSQFARAVEVFMRMDPDAVGVGEIRDEESAEALFDAALTGHPAFGTLHTGDCESIPMRLKKWIPYEDQGDKGFYTLLINQSLVPELCESCKVPFLKSKEAKDPVVIAQVKKAEINPSAIYGLGAGCDHCTNTGVKGRTAVAQVVLLNNKMKRLIRQGKIDEAFEYWYTESEECTKLNVPKTKYEHALRKINGGTLSPLVTINTISALVEEV